MKTRSALALFAATALVSACGTQTATPDSKPTPTQPTTHPTAAPWPSYSHDDYTYVLRRMCFCGDRGVAYLITVTGGEVTDVVYANRTPGRDKGAPAPEPYARVTIEDVIDAANDETAYKVDITWPDGQDYPSAVSVDHSKNAIDEEIGYTLSHVVPAD